ncbi:MAG: hypothetical protein DRP81_07035, partial [Candidatus Omnitrophota bacterium]
LREARWEEQAYRYYLEHPKEAKLLLLLGRSVISFENMVEKPYLPPENNQINIEHRGRQKEAELRGAQRALRELKSNIGEFDGGEIVESEIRLDDSQRRKLEGSNFRLVEGVKKEAVEAVRKFLKRLKEEVKAPSSSDVLKSSGVVENRENDGGLSDEKFNNSFIQPFNLGRKSPEFKNNQLLVKKDGGREEKENIIRDKIVLRLGGSASSSLGRDSEGFESRGGFTVKSRVGREIEEKRENKLRVHSLLDIQLRKMSQRALNSDFADTQDRWMIEVCKAVDNLSQSDFVCIENISDFVYLIQGDILVNTNDGTIFVVKELEIYSDESGLRGYLWGILSPMKSTGGSKRTTYSVGISLREFYEIWKPGLFKLYPALPTQRLSDEERKKRETLREKIGFIYDIEDINKRLPIRERAKRELEEHYQRYLSGDRLFGIRDRLKNRYGNLAAQILFERLREQPNNFKLAKFIYTVVDSIELYLVPYLQNIYFISRDEKVRSIVARYISNATGTKSFRVKHGMCIDNKMGISRATGEWRLNHIIPYILKMMEAGFEVKVAVDYSGSNFLGTKTLAEKLHEIDSEIHVIGIDIGVIFYLVTFADGRRVICDCRGLEYNAWDANGNRLSGPHEDTISLQNKLLRRVKPVINISNQGLITDSYKDEEGNRVEVICAISAEAIEYASRHKLSFAQGDLFDPVSIDLIPKGKVDIAIINNTLGAYFRYFAESETKKGISRVGGTLREKGRLLIGTYDEEFFHWGFEVWERKGNKIYFKQEVKPQEDKTFSGAGAGIWERERPEVISLEDGGEKLSLDISTTSFSCMFGNITYFSILSQSSGIDNLNFYLGFFFLMALPATFVLLGVIRILLKELRFETEGERVQSLLRRREETRNDSNLRITIISSLQKMITFLSQNKEFTLLNKINKNSQDREKDGGFSNEKFNNSFKNEENRDGGRKQAQKYTKDGLIATFAGFGLLEIAFLLPDYFYTFTILNLLYPLCFPSRIILISAGLVSIWVGLTIDEGREEFIKESKDRKNDGGRQDKLISQKVGIINKLLQDGGKKKEEKKEFVFTRGRISKEEALRIIKDELSLLLSSLNIEEKEKNSIIESSLRKTIINTTRFEAFLNSLRLFPKVILLLLLKDKVAAALIILSLIIWFVSKILPSSATGPSLWYLCIALCILLINCLRIPFNLGATLIDDSTFINTYYPEVNSEKAIRFMFIHEFIHQKGREVFGLTEEDHRLVANALTYLYLSEGREEEIIDMFIYSCKSFRYWTENDKKVFKKKIEESM